MEREKNSAIYLIPIFEATVMGKALSWSPLFQEDSIENPMDEPIIVVEDETTIVRPSQEEDPPVDVDDEGGFTSRASFRNNSLKVDMENSPHRVNHHRSYSDAGRNRRKSINEVEMSQIEFNLDTF